MYHLQCSLFATVVWSFSPYSYLCSLSSFLFKLGLSPEPLHLNFPLELWSSTKPSLIQKAYLVSADYNSYLITELNSNQRIDGLISVLCNLTLCGWSATIPQKPGASSHPFIGQCSCCQSNQEFLSGGENLSCFAESSAWIEWCKMDIKFFFMV